MCNLVAWIQRGWRLVAGSRLRTYDTAIEELGGQPWRRAPDITDRWFWDEAPSLTPAHARRRRARGWPLVAASGAALVLASSSGISTRGRPAATLSDGAAAAASPAAPTAGASSAAPAADGTSTAAPAADQPLAACAALAGEARRLRLRVQRLEQRTLRLELQRPQAVRPGRRLRRP